MLSCVKKKEVMTCTLIVDMMDVTKSLLSINILHNQ